MPVLTKAKFRPNPKYRIRVDQALDKDGEKLQKALLSPPPKPTPILVVFAALFAILVVFAAVSAKPSDASQTDQPLILKLSGSLSGY